MKKALRFSAKAFAFILLTVSASNASKANGERDSSELKAKVNYIGNTSDGVLFKIAVVNSLGKKFSVKIKNEDGEVVYVNSFKDKKFDQTFKTPKDLSSKITFEINNENQAYQQSFKIEQRFIDEIVVTNN